MAILEFFALSAINLALIAAIIRRRGIASAEGFCMVYLGMAALTDNLELVFHYIFTPDVLPLGYREFAFRLYPTAAEILGLLVLMAALQLADGRSMQLKGTLCEAELQILRNVGLAIAIIGLAFASIGFYLIGAWSASNFYGALNLFRNQALPFGGFWYRGADLGVFGLGLTLPSLQGKAKRFLLTLIFMMCISFFLRANKGGLEEPIIWGAVILFAYNRAFFRTFLNFKTAAVAVLIAFLGISAKFAILSRAADVETAHVSLRQVLKTGSETAGMRWGDNGLYRGYCQFVSMLPANRAIFQDSKVGLYSLTSWIPRFLYPEKPDHPFRGLGFMVYSDFHTFRDETPAPTLMGSAMADDGLVSLTAYLFLAGLFLGFLRRFSIASDSIYVHSGYMLFILFGGLSAEEGTLGLLYTLFLSFAVVLGARLLLFAKDLFSVRTNKYRISAIECGFDDLRANGETS